MACPERDRGKSATSTIPERLDRRVVIVTPQLWRTRGDRFVSTSIRRLERGPYFRILQSTG